MNISLPTPPQSEAAAELPPGAKGLRVCLAASGGGHIRQLLDLEKAWQPYDYFFLTEETPLSQSLARKHPVFFVDHFAIGQARLGAPFKMLRAAFRNFVQSARIIWRERPDIIISTGAGAVFFAVLWARLLGAKFILIETFARFDRPSAFARAASPFAQHKIVQSSALAQRVSGAVVFDPFEILGTQRPQKKSLVFATVGATLPFDRMVEMVSTLKASGDIHEDLVIQTGIGGFSPAGLQTFETLPFDSMLAYLKEADIVICHGGTGSLITALREGCRTIVMPRHFEKGEHYDNHQKEITRAFAARGLVTTADTLEELVLALKAARARPPVSATTNPSRLINHLAGILKENEAASARALSLRQTRL
jgi:UDP-N-acetylglucosamine--N-acetylmuramyl-(pentapeptide) pyrophosphoryl-undecaprenol N-acetylglucosamine transferase